MNNQQINYKKCKTKKVNEDIWRINTQKGGELVDKKKLIYLILKDLDSGVTPQMQNYDIQDNQIWGNVAEIIENQGFAKEVEVTKGGQGNKYLMAGFSKAKITLSGLNYIEENNHKYE